MMPNCRDKGNSLPPASPASHEQDVNNPEVRLGMQLLLISAGSLLVLLLPFCCTDMLSSKQYKCVADWCCCTQM